MARQIPQMAGGILSYFTRHRTAANLLLVVMVVLGLAAAPQMRAQYLPDVVIDNVSVSVIWDGAGAEDIDSAIIQVMEPVLLAVEGVEGSSRWSSNRAGTWRAPLPMCRRPWTASPPCPTRPKTQACGAARGGIA